ncbi:hypothetical protein [Vallitalea maricola]|uniref:Uncharacterized protein n=1 Tax=Vallitalea maricola TaxID=3074433 RepID=A0ACB5UEG6_9FIRM|nr:hypothetical protein AN2V17_02280 [Vallitalea sp. AN17-2]
MKVIFSDYGIDISEENGHYYITFDEGGFAIQMKTYEITKSDAEKAKLSANDSYQVVIKYQNKEKKHN